MFLNDCQPHILEHLPLIRPNVPHVFAPEQLQTKKKVLRLWAHKMQLGPIVDADENVKYQTLLSHQFECEINERLATDIASLDEDEQLLLADVYVNQIAASDEGINTLAKSTHMQLIEFTESVAPNVWSNKQQFIDRIESTFNYDKHVTTIESCHNNSNTDKVNARVDANHKYFPIGDKGWMKTWLRYLHGHHTATSIKSMIEDAHDPEISNIVAGDYCPKSCKQLNDIHVKHALFNPLVEITVHESEYDQLKTVVSSYDSFVNDVKIFYECDVLRHSLMANIDQWYKLKKANPLHCRQDVPHGLIHPCQTRFARRPLFLWLEQVVFIHDKFNESKWPTTLAVLPGSYTFNLRDKIFALVTFVHNKQWSINFVKDKITKLIEMSESFYNDVNALFDSASDPTNELLHPIYSVSALCFHWKFERCNLNAHSHDQCSDHELFIELNDVQQNVNDLIQELSVDSNYLLANLWIGDLQTHCLEDFNKHDYSDTRPKQSDWRFKYVIVNEERHNPINISTVRDLLYGLFDPLQHLIPGPKNCQLKNTATALLSQFNMDGFGLFKCENAHMPHRSVCQHYLCPLHCIISKKLLVSIGITTEWGNNESFLNCFVTDVIRSMFNGIDCVFNDSQGHEHTLCVFVVIAMFLVDGKEVKSLTGLAGPNSSRSDYYTIVHRDASVWEMLTRATRHQNVLLTQSHINYLRYIGKVFGSIAMHTDSQIQYQSLSYNSRKSFDTLIEQLFRSAGISPTKKPTIERLPTLSLIKVEFAHMMYHHLLTNVCVAIKSTHLKCDTNKDMEALMQYMWQTMIDTPHYPSKTASTYFRGCTQGSTVSQKAVHVYLSSFILGLNGIVLGFEPQSVCVLRRILRWNGIFFSGNLDGWDHQWLINECMDICALIEEMPHFCREIAQSPCLQIWRNLMNMDMYLWAIPEHFVGLMYDGEHKKSLNILRYHSKFDTKTILNSHNKRQRIIKDVQAMSVGWKPRNQQSLGSGLSQLLQDIGHDHTNVTKILSYKWKFENNNDHENDVQIGAVKHIIPMHLRHIAMREFLQLEQGWGNIFTNKNYASVQCDLIHENLDHIWDTIFDRNTIDESMKHIVILHNAIQSGQIRLYVTNGCASLWYTYLDSHFRRNDLCWMRTVDQDLLMDIQLFVCIKGLTQCPQLQQYLDTTVSSNMNDLLLFVGRKWMNISNPDEQLNYEIYDIDDSPVVCPGDNVICVSSEFAVQQMMVIHDHIIPSVDDMSIISQNVACYPPNQFLQFKFWRNYQYNDATRNSNYCGLKLDANLHPQCLCRTDIHPFFKAYSIFQGFVPRLCSNKNINEMFWF